MDEARTTDRAWIVALCAATLAVFALPRGAAAETGAPPPTADPTEFTVGGGLTGYADPAPDGPPPPTTPTVLRTQGSDANGVGPLPALSSRPGSANTIYLDFDGHRVDGGVWLGLNFGLPIIAGGFDRDGQPATFDTAEQDLIRQVWESVAEDYAPFDVDVTTVDPGVGRLVGRSTGSGTSGVRVVVTNGWTGTAAGLALVGTFGSGDRAPGTQNWSDTPVWVFADRLYNDPGNIALAAAHEAGHALGLHHDGRAGATHCTSAEYYCGHPRPAGTWAPIMGAGYGRPITQWARGEYSGATNTEDDVAVIGDALGFAADDHGDRAATATPISASASVPGLLGFGDVDQFVLAAGAGPLRATLAPAGSNARASNLYARLDVYDADGRLVAAAGPNAPLRWSAPIAVDVPAGDYRLVVTPIGYLTPDDGFSAYASAGRYRLDVAALDGGVPPALPVQPQAPGGDPAVATSGLVPITPVRVLDTRTGSVADRPPAGGVVRVDLAAALGVTATAAVLNITAVDPEGPGYLAAVPCAVGRPTTSSVNYAAHQTVANTTIATLGPDGSVCVYTLAAADVIVDVTGWLEPSVTGGLTPAPAMRLADTRQTGRLAAGGVLEIDVPAHAPPGVTGLAVNVTAVAPDGAGYLTAYPCEAARPGTSSVNYAAGEVRANNAIVATPSGRLCVYTRAATDVVVDLSGYVTPDGLRYVPAIPARLADTRIDPAGPLRPGEIRAFAVPAAPNGGPRAVTLNLVAVDHRAPGYMTAYDCGAVPPTSTLNQAVGEVVANGAIVGLDTAERFCIRSLQGGHAVADLAGWWTD